MLSLEPFRKDGVIVVRGAVNDDLVSRSVREIWQHIVDLPWQPKEKELWRGLQEDFKTDPCKQPTKEQTLIATENYPMTGGFAALTLPPAFHLNTQWEMRQSETVIAPFRQIYSDILKTDNPKLMVAIDRVSFKFPGQGTTEFCHWDSNPFYWQESTEELQGIVALCDTSFFAVPGTHTDEFRQEFIDKYPKSTRKDQYLVYEHDSEGNNTNPMGLRKRVVEYKLQKGDLIIWSNRLLHEARKNKTKLVRYAYFITYFPHGNPSPTVKNSSVYKKNDTDWLSDRISSYENGTNPLLFPSGTEVSLYAKMHLMSHPHILNNFCAKFTIGSTKYTYQDGKKKGTVVNLPIGWNPLTEGLYVPPTLTAVGRELLGL